MKHLSAFVLALLLLLGNVDAQQGNALHFDGTNDQVVCGLPTVFSNISANNFTMEAWVYPTGAIFSRIIYAQFATNNFATMSASATNTIYFYVVSNGTNYSATTSATMPSNQWTHVAVRWTAATQSVAIFFNGVQQTTTGGGTSSTGTSGIMTLGTRPGGAQYFPGALDEVRIWSKALSACEILGNMNRHFTGPQTDLVAYYDFDHGVASGTNTGITTLSDYSGGGYNGTLTNFALTGSTSNWIASTANITTSGNAVLGYNLTATAAVCSGGSYTFPDGSSQSNITAQVVQTSTLTATSGCDSVIVTTVNVNPSFAASDSAWVCSGGSYTYPDSSTDTNITAQVVHVSTLTATTGCDSVITTTVDVLPSYNLAESAAVCSGGSYLYPDGTIDTNITTQTVHTSTLTTGSGCDSIIVTTVGVLPTYYTLVSDSVCAGGSYTFPDGTTQTNILAQVTHVSAFQSVQGCDSMISTTVDAHVVDTAVSLAGTTLTANLSGAAYQWIDCVTGFPVTGQTAASFTPAISGSYAVVILDGACTDTSSCHAVTVVGLDNGLAAGIGIYPNPNHGSFILQLPASLGAMVEVELLNAVGQVVYAAQLPAGAHAIGSKGLAVGIYTLRVHAAGGMVPVRMIVTQ